MVTPINSMRSRSAACHCSTHNWSARRRRRRPTPFSWLVHVMLYQLYVARFL